VSKTYRVVFVNLLHHVDGFKAGMAKFGVEAAVADRILRKAPVVLKSGLDWAEAREYAEAVRQAGGRAVIQEQEILGDPRRTTSSLQIPSLKKFTKCPECGYKQIKSAACERCGFPLEGRGEGRLRE